LNVSLLAISAAPNASKIKPVCDLKYSRFLKLPAAKQS
jgi:hypothetical protein